MLTVPCCCACLQWDAHELHWAGDQSGIGRGVELYFVVDDFDDVLERVDQLRAEMVQENRPLTEAFQTRELKILDRDGYVVGIGDRSKGWLANSGLT
jgi:hypothetical protein